MEDKEPKKLEEQEESPKEKETLEDKLDEVIFHAENALYGEKENIQEDIPATTYDSNGYRRINKHATRKNLGKLVIRHLPKIAFSFVALAFLIGFILLIRSFF